MASVGNLYFSRDDGFDDESIEFVLSGSSVIVSVAEEQAMDSYNAMFTCSFHMNRTEMQQLSGWLIAALAQSPDTE